MTIELSILKRFDISRRRDREKHLAGDAEKLGNLRAGSTGALSPSGEFVGACPRKSLIRAEGIELEEPTTDKLIMFELGFANEDRMMEVLVNSLTENEVIKREEEIPIEWFTTAGTKVTGRPDIVICEQVEGQIVPKLVLELKSVHSMWTATKVLFGRKPSLNNLAQAAHYMWKLGVPGKLIYKSYSQLGQGMGGQEWITKQLPKPGEPYSEYLDFSVQKRDPSKYNIKHIKQFEQVYDLKFDSKGTLYFKLEQEEDVSWTSTILSKQSLEAYFEFVSKMKATDALGPRPLTLQYDGSDASYSECAYCPLNSMCNSLEKRAVTSTKLFLEETNKYLNKPQVSLK